MQAEARRAGKRNSARERVSCNARGRLPDQVWLESTTFIAKPPTMTCQNICVLGGGGFVGSHLVPLLAARGYRVVVPTRRRERSKHLLVLPGVEVVETDIHDPAALQSLLMGMDAVINLVGILHETRRGDFQHAHVELPRKMLAACAASGVPRLLHMSALGADAASKSLYQQSKSAGETLVREAQDIAATVFRPSVIFGPGDSFLSLFADLLQLAPLVPLADAGARFQPVFVGDVARAFADALERQDTFGKRYNLCGPNVYSLAELVRLTASTLGMRRAVLPLDETASFQWSIGDPWITAVGSRLPRGEWRSPSHPVAPLLSSSPRSAHVRAPATLVPGWGGGRRCSAPPGMQSRGHPARGTLG